MTGFLGVMWLSFTLGIAAENWRTRRTMLFPVLWFIHGVALILTYGLAGWLGAM